MTDRDLREESTEPDPPPRRRRRRGLFFGNLAKVARPPMTTPQWKDAIREDEAHGKKKDERD
ncbi:MAG TPA: hypothetical protein VH817_06840 [Thermoleophilaceae bacterium]